MSTAVQFRRGTTAQHSSFTGAVGEITVDTDKKTAVVHDGSTAGGQPLMPSSGGTFTSDISLAGQAAVRFLDADSSHWVAFRAPATVTSNLTWTLPATNGAGALTNDGSGTLSWSSGGVSLGLAVALG